MGEGGWVILYRREFFFQTLSCASNFLLGASVCMIFFSEVACVSPSGSVFQEKNFGSGRVHEFFSCTRSYKCACWIFFSKSPNPPNPLEVKWSTHKNRLFSSDSCIISLGQLGIFSGEKMTAVLYNFTLTHKNLALPFVSY